MAEGRLRKTTFSSTTLLAVSALSGSVCLEDGAAGFVHDMPPEDIYLQNRVILQAFEYVNALMKLPW